MNRILFSLLFVGALAAPVLAAAPAETIVVDAAARTRPFPHFWEKMFGSGRAVLSLRESYRRDLRSVKKITGFEYVRFHAIFHDELGVYSEDAKGAPVYNFSYVDQIYDGLLENGVRPFVELSFMPSALAATPVKHPFWYHPSPAPPKDWERWEGLIEAFTRHLVARYGADEVAQWYFEVWNEPNIDFWAGDPKEATYYELYDRAARAIKRVDPRLRVGGPSTAQAAWADRFIRHCADKNVPVDFVSTHVYGNDTAGDVFGSTETIPRTDMVCRAVRKVRDQIAASPRPELPLIFSEYNATYWNEPGVTDEVFMGPWLADTIRQCDGLAQMMSYWSFSDVFEEGGVVKTPFYGGFGLMAEDNLPKPSFNAFALLHRLGEERIPVDAKDVLATRRADGSLALAVWNLSLPEEKGETRTVSLKLAGLSGKRRATVTRVDENHGSLRTAYIKMGSPATPTRAQIAALQKAGAESAPEKLELKDGVVTVTLAPKALALIEIR